MPGMVGMRVWKSSIVTGMVIPGGGGGGFKMAAP